MGWPADAGLPGDAAWSRGRASSAAARRAADESWTCPMGRDRDSAFTTRVTGTMAASRAGATSGVVRTRTTPGGRSPGQRAPQDAGMGRDPRPEEGREDGQRDPRPDALDPPVLGEIEDHRVSHPHAEDPSLAQSDP